MNDITSNETKVISDYLKLLLVFNALPRNNRSRTFMEISGYPHYENVCSNILGFYFENNAEHGLQNLFLSAFLKMADVDTAIPNSVVNVYREFGTGSGRIDLVIEGESFVIAIENKIFHWLANDLDDYANAITSQMSEKQIVIKAVLGLNPIIDERLLKGGFVSYTYNQFWQEVRSLLGEYIGQANQKWITYLIDFMETTTNLSGQNMELKQTDQFFIEHNDAITTMLNDREAFLGRLTHKISMLAEEMKETTEGAALAKLPYMYANDRLVLDFKKLGDNYEISFDFYLTPAGWSLQLFGRGTPSYIYLLKLVKQPSLREKIQAATLKEKRYYVQKWDVQADLGEIRDSLCQWLNAISMAANSVANEV